MIKNKFWWHECNNPRNPSLVFTLIINSPNNTLMIIFFPLLCWYREWIVRSVWKTYLIGLVAMLCIVNLYNYFHIQFSFLRIWRGWDFWRPAKRVTSSFVFFFFLDIFHNLSLFSLRTYISLSPNVTPIFLFIPFWDYLLISRNYKVTQQYIVTVPMSNTQSHCPHKYPHTCQTTHPATGCRKSVSSSSRYHLSKRSQLS